MHHYRVDWWVVHVCAYWARVRLLHPRTWLKLPVVPNLFSERKTYIYFSKIVMHKVVISLYICYLHVLSLREINYLDGVSQINIKPS